MAIYHYHIQSIGRNLSTQEGSGMSAMDGGKNKKIKPNRSAVACSAYRSANCLNERIYDKESGLWFENRHDYTYKQGVEYSKIFAPKGAPSWMIDREELWNKIQNEFDIRSNSVFAKEMDIALPRELSVEQNIELIEEYATDVLMAFGLVVDVNFHNDNPENPHFHVMTSTRHLVTLEDGSLTFGKKIEQIDSKRFLYYLRAAWAACANKYLERYGFSERIDHRSYKDRGISIVPTIHEGIGRHSKESDRARINAEIISVRSAQIVEDHSLIIKLLGYEKAFFKLSDIEERIAEFIFDDGDAMSFFIKDSKISSGVNDNIAGGVDENRIFTSIAEAIFDVNFDLNAVDSSENVLGMAEADVLELADCLERDASGRVLLNEEAARNLTETRLKILESILGSDEIVRLESLEPLGEYYTTRARVSREEEFLAQADRLWEARSPGGALRLALTSEEVSILENLGSETGELLSDEQKNVVNNLINSPGNLGLLYGYAGTGKSRLLKGLAQIYEGRGVNVVGLAPTAKSREVLSGIGLKSHTIHSLRYKEDLVAECLKKIASGNAQGLERWQLAMARNYKTPFDGNTVFVLDEASMVDLDLFVWMIEKCLENDCKLILIGDYNQLAVVKGIGGGFRILVERYEAGVLSQIWRQSDEGDREVTKLLANYKVSEALAFLREKKVDRFNFIEGELKNLDIKIVSDYVSWFVKQNVVRLFNREELFETKIGEVIYEVGSKLGVSVDGGPIDVARSGVIISYFREDVDRLNKMIRRSLFISGVLEAPRVSDSAVVAAFCQNNALSNIVNENAGINANDNQNFDDGSYASNYQDELRDYGVEVARGINNEHKSISLLLGEQIMFLKNDSRIGLYNGEVGTILKISDQPGKILGFSDGDKENKVFSRYILVRIHSEDNARVLWFDTGEYGHFDYGYAQTIHKVQGSSYSEIFVYFRKMIGFEAFYVAMTRHRENMRFYASKEELLEVLYKRYGVAVENDFIKIKSTAKNNISNFSSNFSEICDKDLYFAGLENYVNRRNEEVFVSQLVTKKNPLKFVQDLGSDDHLSAYLDSGSDFDVTDLKSAIELKYGTEYFKESEAIDVFADYYDVRSGTSKVYREMLIETEKERALGNSHVKIYHHENWRKFTLLKMERQVLAHGIISDMPKFETALKITHANIMVIRDHAGEMIFGLEKEFLPRITLDADMTSRYRSLCKLQVNAMYSGDASLISDLLVEAAALYHEQKAIKLEIDSLAVEKVSCASDMHRLSYEIDSCNNDLRSIRYGISNVYDGDIDQVAQKFRDYISESAIGLSGNVGVDSVEIDGKLLDKKLLLSVDLENFGTVHGKIYDFKLFTLNSFDRNKNLRDKEFVLNSLKLYLESVSILERLKLEFRSAEKNYPDIIAEIDSKAFLAKSKYLGDIVMDHLGEILSQEDFRALEEWLGTSGAKNRAYVGISGDYSEPQSDTADTADNDEGSNKRLVTLESPESALTMTQKKELLKEAKIELLSKLSPVVVREFFEAHRVNAGLSDAVVVSSGMLKCGSFSLNLGPEKFGKWYRFSERSGGDIYRLARYLGVSKEVKPNSYKQGSYKQDFENFRVIAALAGIVIENESDFKKIKDLECRSDFGTSHEYTDHKDVWQIYDLVPEGVSYNVKKDTPTLLYGGSRCERIYDYRNIDGKLIGHIVRIKTASGSKDVRPVVYAKNIETGVCSWRMKGFANTIYGLEYFGMASGSAASASTPSASTLSVLIVEGEKTCDAARRLVGDEYVVISWNGGSSAAGKVDWSPLAGRDVVIWPDADSPGIRAAGLIAHSLSENNIEVRSLNIVDVRSLGLVGGWDLADDLPEHLREFSIKEIIDGNSSIVGKVQSVVREEVGSIEWGSLATISDKMRVLENVASTRLKELGLYSSIYKVRLAHELSVIQKFGYGEEFKVAANVVKFCKSRNIAVGFGRGSAVGSLTAYLLDIHSVDPIKYDLKFERFLSEGKSTIPDFDIDVSSKDRERLVEYLFRDLGERVALMTTNDGRRHPSGVVILPEGMSRSDVESSGACRFKIDDKSMRPIMSLNDGVKFKELERQGFRKVDLLSSNMLDKTYSVIDEINQKYGVSLSVDEIFSAAWNDKEAYGLIARGDTEGIFQLESESAKDICKSIRPKDFDSLVNILALNRPGTREWVPLFAQESTGESDQESQISRNVRIPIPPHDPALVFASTKGAILFQEQVMEAGVKYFGVGEKDSDEFRRDLASNLEDRVIANKDKCIERLMSSHKDISRGQAVSLYSSLEKFAGFGFNKSHAVAYAKHTLVSAYLKAHYREEFERNFGVAKDKSSNQVFDKSDISKSSDTSKMDHSYEMRVHSYLQSRIVQYMKYAKISDKYAQEFVTDRMTHSSREELNMNKDPVYNKDITISKRALSILLDEFDKEKISRNKVVSYVQAELLIDGTSQMEEDSRKTEVNLDNLVRDKIVFAVSAASFEVEAKKVSAGKRREDLIFKDIFEERTDYNTRASDNLSVEHDGEKIARISAMRSAKLGVKLTFDEREEIHMLYDSRDEKILFELGSNPKIKGFRDESGELAAKYLAGQVVDYKMQHGQELDPSSRRFEIMKNVANEQALLDQQMNSRFSADSSTESKIGKIDISETVDTSKNDTSKNKPSSDEVLTKSIIAQDRISAIKLATHRLCENMTMKIQELGVQKLDVARCQAMRNAEVLKVEKELHLSQRAYVIDRTEELQAKRGRELDRGHGMSF